MIELIYNEEGASDGRETALIEPKNVKQIGEPPENKKIFLEDYVHTYLLQYSTTEHSGTSVAVLFGKSECAGAKRYLYIQSAMTIQGISEKQGTYHFAEKVWGDIYQECEKYFPGQEIVGWFLGRPGFPVEKNSVMEETHRTYFSGADKVLFLLEPLEGESGFFAFDGSSFARQPGYYIYYEKNDAMRDFIMAKNEQQRKKTTTEKPDAAVASFRKIIREKQERSARRRKMAISYGARTAAALLLIAGAAAMKHQADRVAEMEQRMNTLEQEEPVSEASAGEVVVEELPGQVEARPDEAQQESAELPEQELPVAEAHEEEAAEEAVETQMTYVEYIVQEGDTLSKICKEHYGSRERLQEICEFNGIEDGDYIQAGEIILLP